MKKICCCLCICLYSCTPFGFLPEPADHPVAVVDELYKQFKDRYALFEQRGLNWDSTYAVNRGRVFEGMTDDSLFNVLTRMLAPLDDGHVQLMVPGKDKWYSNRIYREGLGFELFDTLFIQQNYLRATERGDGYFKGQIGNHLYVHFTYIGAPWLQLPGWLKTMPANSVLILDLRHNSGGDFTYALEALRWLNGERRSVFLSRTKNGPSGDAYTPWYNWFLEKVDNPVQNKVIVLTDRFTLSAAERTTMMLRSLPNVKLLGDTTNGGISTVVYRDLPNRWITRIPVQQVLSPSGENFEGQGIPPQEIVLNPSAPKLLGTDLVLDRAIQLANMP